MKKLSLTLGFTFISLFLSAQELKKTFVPYYLVNDEAVEFERIGAKIEAKAIGFGYGGINTYYTVFKSKNSSTQFKSNEFPKFIIKLDENTEVFELVIITKADKVKKKKTYRRFVKSGSSMGGSKDFGDKILYPNLKEIGPNLYEIILEKQLESGEYAFMPIFKGQQAGNIMTSSGKIMLYCFGVDN